jgi:thymidylate synthase ThyX
VIALSAWTSTSRELDDAKRAKESARYFKLYNFLTQRMDGHAQIEIQRIAYKMLQAVRDIEGAPFQHRLEAWGWGE